MLFSYIKGLKDRYSKLFSPNLIVQSYKIIFFLSSYQKVYIVSSNILTIFVHVDIETLLQSAGPALVSMNLVNGTIPLSIRSSTSVTTISSDTSLEESTTAIAGVYSIMFSR